MKLRTVIGLIIITLFVSCKKENLDDCFTNAGKKTTVSRQPGYYHTISLNDNVNLVLQEGNGFSITVEGGENLLGSVITEVHDSVLVISNNMKCNWVRDYDNELTVYASASSLKAITYESSGDVSTKGNVRFDKFEINVWGGSGSINLDVDCERIGLGLHYGTVDFHVKGKSVLASIYANSYGPFYCQELNSNIVYITNNGTNDCYIHANHILGAKITSVGNIYYTGNPYDLSSNITGSGRLIKVDQ